MPGDKPLGKTLDVSATYRSPADEPFAVSRPVPAPPSAAVADRTRCLAALRRAVADTQAVVNRELTARMDRDRARDAAAAGPAPSLAVDEDKEEQNYGEEAQGDD